MTSLGSGSLSSPGIITSTQAAPSWPSMASSTSSNSATVDTLAVSHPVHPNASGSRW